jgi:hypothetical protein
MQVTIKSVKKYLEVNLPATFYTLSSQRAFQVSIEDDILFIYAGHSIYKVDSMPLQSSCLGNKEFK